MRVSTRSQSFPSQRHDITTVSKARGDRVTLWLQEKRSGAKLGAHAAPELERLRKLARAGKIRKLYVQAIDRLSRSESISETMRVVEELHRHGVGIISCTDGFDIHGPEGELVLAVMAWRNKRELERIGQRVRAARAAAAAAGKPWGKPRAVGKMKEHQIRELHREGFSIRDIAARLRIPRSTIGDLLSGKGPYGERSKPSGKRRVRPVSG